MSDTTHIEWTDATWNIVTGCTRVSAGCDHCYIERTPPFRMAGRKFDGDGPGSTTGVVLHPERLDKPLSWRKPRRIFVNSLADLFHDDVPDDYIARVWAVMASSAAHTFQVLTKRHARMRSLLNSEDFHQDVAEHWTRLLHVGPSREQNPFLGWRPLRNVWLGVSVESQQWADIRIPALLDTPAAVRFISAEPLLGPVDLSYSSFIGGDWLKGLGWVIVGGESGPGARPMQPAWARSLRDQCVAAGVPFLFKQWGEHAPHYVGDEPAVMQRVGKKAAGRELDGRTWDEYPDGAA